MKLLKSCCPSFPLDSTLARNFLPAGGRSIASAVVNTDRVYIEMQLASDDDDDDAMRKKEDDN